MSTGTVGAYSQSYTIGLSDDQSLAGNTALASQTFTVTGSVLNHALASLSTNSANFGTVITGASVANQIDDPVGRLGLLCRLADHQPGRPQRQHQPDCGRRQHGLSASVSTGTVGAYSQSYTIGLSDDQSLAGNTALASQTFTVTGSVFDHALASLSTNSANFGTVITGASVGNQIDEPAKRLGLPGRLADHQPRRLERQHEPDRGRRQHGPVGRGEHGLGGRVLAELHGRPVRRSEPGGQHGLASQTFTVTGSVLDHALASLSPTRPTSAR